MEKTDIKVGKFLTVLKEIFGSGLVSVIGYGSIAGGTYVPGKSDINLIVVIDNFRVTDIMQVRKKLLKHAIKNAITPFFFSPGFLKSSPEVFPVEWKEIKTGHIIFYGRDVTEDISIDKKDLRLQIERELKQNYIDFQQGLVFDRDVFSTLRESYKSLTVVLRNMKDIYADEFEKPGYLEKLGSCYSGKIKLKKAEILEIAEQHLAYINKLINIIEQVESDKS